MTKEKVQNKVQAIQCPKEKVQNKVQTIQWPKVIGLSVVYFVLFL
jgi:hypothetical protein